MKAAFTTFIAFAIASAGATTAVAESSMDFAIRHFNESADSMSDVRRAPEAPSARVTVSQMGQSQHGTALRILNEGAESRSDLIGVNGLTLVPGEPAYAAEIFDRLREESAGQD